jgi:hypothetical protein
MMLNNSHSPSRALDASAAANSPLFQSPPHSMLENDDDGQLRYDLRADVAMDHHEEQLGTIRQVLPDAPPLVFKHLETGEDGHPRIRRWSIPLCSGTIEIGRNPFYTAAQEFYGRERALYLNRQASHIVGANFLLLAANNDPANYEHNITTTAIRQSKEARQIFIELLLDLDTIKKTHPEGTPDLAVTAYSVLFKYGSKLCSKEEPIDSAQEISKFIYYDNKTYAVLIDRINGDSAHWKSIVSIIESAVDSLHTEAATQLRIIFFNDITFVTDRPQWCMNN